MYDRAASYFRELQDRIVTALAELDGGARFSDDVWARPGGGGGRTRVASEGALFEKAGVSFSDVRGDLRSELAASLPGSGTSFRAVGVSLVLHPRSPHVPIVHANFRRIERGDAGWFGGGTDLTPSYVRREDVAHFHRVLRSACQRFDPKLYARFKAWCDDYFFIAHRAEPRGTGGVFFDYLGAGAERAAGRAPAPQTAVEEDPERIFDLVRAVGDSFLPAYVPIALRRRHEPWTPEQRRWQLIRRGRYVEFNLVYDRGTVFGLRTDGRVESILMSLPPEARWEYSHDPDPGSPEAATIEAIRARRDWAEDDAEKP